MSLELSPEAVLFSVRRKIDTLEQRIAELTQKLRPEPPVKIVKRRFFDRIAARHRTVERVSNKKEIDNVRRFNRSFYQNIGVAQRELAQLESQIPILLKDAEVKRELNLLRGGSSIDQKPSIDNLTSQVGLLTDKFAGSQIPTNPKEPKKDNTLRNALLVLGAVLVLV